MSWLEQLQAHKHIPAQLEKCRVKMIWGVPIWLLWIPQFLVYLRVATGNSPSAPSLIYFWVWRIQAILVGGCDWSHPGWGLQLLLWRHVLPSSNVMQLLKKTTNTILGQINACPRDREVLVPLYKVLLRPHSYNIGRKVTKLTRGLWSAWVI